MLLSNDERAVLLTTDGKGRDAKLAILKRLEVHAELSDGCLQMVYEKLVWLLGEEAMKATPPMNYNDAIEAAMHKLAMGELRADLYPAGSLLHRLRAAEQRLAAPTSGPADRTGEWDDDDDSDDGEETDEEAEAAI